LHDGPQPALGLALSGGGFRAAFFHVGVLARLAELGLLRHVTLISTVSGGSIAGALYYLMLLRRRPVTDTEYCMLVHALGEELRFGVQRNLRARVFRNVVKNADMLVRPGYSRSDRIGDLLDKVFYKRWNPRPARRFDFLTIDRQVELRHLAPPRGYPHLVLNATALNTGHGWQFDPTGMGESTLPGDEQGIDRNTRLARGWFRPDEVHPAPEPAVPEAQQDFPFALAVAASAALPGLFAPIAISGMYRPDIRVRLMDGGAHDNQGVETLLRSHLCSEYVVSDASSQLEDVARPVTVLPRLLMRATAIYGDRVREQQLVDLPAGRSTLIHLRDGLEAEEVNPVGYVPPATPAPAPAVPGVHPDVQWALARTRTDLDAFHDLEIYSLMLNGYLIAKARLPRAPVDLAGCPWPFDALRGDMRSGRAEYVARLRVGASRTPKALRLLPEPVRLLAVAALAALVLAIGRAIVSLDVPGAHAWRIALAAGGLALGAPALALLASTVARRRGAWVPRVTYAAAIAGFPLAAFWQRDRLGAWTGIRWPGWALALGTLLVAVALPLAPALLALALSLEGRVYLRRGRL
jgi:NTE family protein